MRAMGAAAVLLLGVVLVVVPLCHGFEFKEATIDEMQEAFQDGSLTSRQLVEYYQRQIRELNPRLHAVIEVNEDALAQADRADEERRQDPSRSRSRLHGIPVLVKDNIATKDKLQTTAGSLALENSRVRRDAFVIKKLRNAGAIILGKASLTEWSGFRSQNTPPGWSARGGQGMNPYTGDANVSGSSSGSAIAVAANMAAVSVAMETDGSILSPSEYHSVVGLKPTVGLTSRHGVIPVSPRQDSVGAIARTVTDAVHLLDVIAGSDANDPETAKADQWIPNDKYRASLRRNGLKGKRLGILRGNDFFPYQSGSPVAEAYEAFFSKMRQEGAELVDNLSIHDAHKFFLAEFQALKIEMKQSLNNYLQGLRNSKVRSLDDVINFNLREEREKVAEYGQEWLQKSAQSNENELPMAVQLLRHFTENGLKKLMRDYNLDAVVAPTSRCATALAIGRFPGITVPVGFDAEKNGLPFGVCIGGFKASEPRLIEIAYAIEQATQCRRPPATLAEQMQPDWVSSY